MCIHVWVCVCETYRLRVAGGMKYDYTQHPHHFDIVGSKTPFISLLLLTNERESEREREREGHTRRDRGRERIELETEGEGES